MRRVFLALGILAAAGASWNVASADPPIWAYRYGSDWLKIASGGLAGRACVDVIDEVSVGRLPEDCYRLDVSKRYRGVWLDVFDGNGCFLPGRETLPDEIDEQECMDLIDDPVRLPRVDERSGDDGARLQSRAMLVEVAGRQTLYPRVSAPTGGSLAWDLYKRHAVTIDEVVSLRVLREERAAN